jgi:anti-sigma B factor antagonist
MRTEGQATVVAVTGELDLASSPELEQRLEQFYAANSELLVIDLRGLEFMDSTGLSVIVSAQQKLIDAGRRLIIVRGPQQVQRLLDLTGVAERLELVDTPDEVLTEG